MAGPANAKRVLHSGRHASAIKRARQAAKRRLYNRGNKIVMRKAIKDLRIKLASGDNAAAAEALKLTIPIIAKNVSRGVIPAGRGSRTISRLTRAVNSIPSS